MNAHDLSALPESIYPEIYLAIARTQGAEHARGRPFSWTSSSHPVWGRACFNLDLGDADEETLSQLASRMRSLDCLAQTGVRSQPSDIEARLERSGFTRTASPAGMVLTRDWFKPKALPEGMGVVECSGEEEWLAWSGIVCRNLFMKASDGEAVAFARMARDIAATGSFRAWLARSAEGRPMGTSAALRCDAGIEGVFFVAVEASARRRGLGGALTSTASGQCLDRGAEAVALGATALGRPVYEALGYRTVSVMGRFRAPPG